MNAQCAPAVLTRALEAPAEPDCDTFTFLEVGGSPLSGPRRVLQHSLGRTRVTAVRVVPAISWVTCSRVDYQKLTVDSVPMWKGRERVTVNTWLLSPTLQHAEITRR